MPALLQHWVTRQAVSRPRARAVVLGNDSLSYAELNSVSNRIAGSLKGVRCENGDRVCVLMAKSPLAIAAMLGVYKADCVYVPVDPFAPPARIARIIEAADCRCILADGSAGVEAGSLLPSRDGSGDIAIGCLNPDARPAAGGDADFRFQDVLACPDTEPECTRGAADAAHILFTSGSTGTPKGVVITHANVNHFISWASGYFGLTASDRVSGHPPLHFDLSFFDIFGAFSAGAELHLVPAELNFLPHRLVEWMRKTELTQWFSVPSALSYIARFDAVCADDLPALRRLLWCGEVLPTPVLAYWMKRLPHVRFTNLYGPTESTIASSYFTVPECPVDRSNPIPIGTACDGEELLILDAQLRPVPRGETGDLFIRGAGLSPGYWRDPAQTTAAFIPCPGSAPGARMYRTGDLARMGDDGNIYFLGRRDSQIKSRGYRIELGEIEAALHQVEALGDCAVIAVPSDDFEGTTICCAYVPAPGANVSTAQLRSELGRTLPSYMLPSRWMALDELPRNGNGKCDIQGLRKAFQQNAIQAH